MTILATFRRWLARGVTRHHHSPPEPRYANSGAVPGLSVTTDSIPVLLTGGWCLIPSGKDPHRWDLDPDECVLSATTSRCIRNHEPPPGGHADWSRFRSHFNTGDQT